ncbi:MAG: T9SS type A sorting domain-containing protein [Bacteroidetes bacterium]|nr:T9SS type A sorting domain-containing protein [Bacteroidota bacterium]
MKIAFFFAFLFVSKISFAQFGSPQIIDSTLNQFVRNILTADINNDGLKDIITTNFHNEINWYKNNGVNFIKMTPINTTLGTPYHLDTRDINLDGQIDILVTNSSINSISINLLLNNSNGTSWTEVTIDDSIDAAAVKSYFVDIENDGDYDIISCHDLEVATYENLGNGNFGPRKKVASNNEFYNMAVKDFNGDGFTDFAVHSAHGFQLYINNHFGVFNLTKTISQDIDIFINSCDFDNDGDFDLQFPTQGSSSDLTTLKNDGLGNFSSFQSSYFYVGHVQNAPYFTTKLNADNFIDVVYAPIVANGLYYKINDGTGNLINPALIDSNFIYRAVYADDLDNDGDNDIIWGAFTKSNMSNLLGWTKNNNTPASVPQIEKVESLIFPNPTNSVINIITNCLGCKFSVSNVMGKQLIESESKLINISTLSDGIYYILITSKNGQKQTIKWVKE